MRCGSGRTPPSQTWHAFLTNHVRTEWRCGRRHLILPLCGFGECNLRHLALEPEPWKKPKLMRAPAPRRPWEGSVANGGLRLTYWRGRYSVTASKATGLHG
jgi:hypothetical protein